MVMFSSQNFSLYDLQNLGGKEGKLRRKYPLSEMEYNQGRKRATKSEK